MPPSVGITRVDFESDRAEPVFEDETPMAIRLCERDWRYRRHGEERVRTANRWRLELLVDAKEAEPLKPGHFIVVAQEPYSNQWLQYAKLLRYSKKSERPTPELPADLPPDTDPVDWVERDLRVDPWETSDRYVAGISFPNGFWTAEPRNTAGDLIFGVCPDRDRVIEKLLRSHRIKDLLRATECNAIKFVFPDVGDAPPLDPEVIDEAPALMDNAIQQALAGPAKLDGWKGREVAEWVGMIFRDHLNNRNRWFYRQRKRERS